MTTNTKQATPLAVNCWDFTSKHIFCGFVHCISRNFLGSKISWLSSSWRLVLWLWLCEFLLPHNRRISEMNTFSKTIVLHKQYIHCTYPQKVGRWSQEYKLQLSFSAILRWNNFWRYLPNWTVIKNKTHKYKLLVSFGSVYKYNSPKDIWF